MQQQQCESYLNAPEDAVSVYAVLCAAAVHHRGAGVTVVACCMAANTERETRLFRTGEHLCQTHIGSQRRKLFNQ